MSNSNDDTCYDDTSPIVNSPNRCSELHALQYVDFSGPIPDAVAASLRHALDYFISQTNRHESTPSESSNSRDVNEESRAIKMKATIALRDKGSIPWLHIFPGYGIVNIPLSQTSFKQPKDREHTHVVLRNAGKYV